MPSAIDPTFIADGTPVSKPAFREQLLTLRAELEHGGYVINPVTLAESTTSQALADVHGAAATPAVGTIAELQAIPPTPGRTIEVLGYHAPGDGGGGLFYADLSGARQSDGGIVFGHTGDEATHTRATTSPNALFGGSALGQTDMVFGSLSFSSDDPADDVVYTDLDLNGHTSGGGLTTTPVVDHKAATITSSILTNFFNVGGGASGGPQHTVGTVTLSYKYLTNARRWVRVTDGYTMSARWFGLTGSGDERNKLCWALNAAKRLGYKEFRLDGSYQWYGAINIPSLTFGWGKLTVIGNDRVMEYIKDDYLTTYPFGTPVDNLQGDKTCVAVAHNVSELGFKSLELDGNYQNNLHALENGSQYNRTIGLSNALQNTSRWAGIDLSRADGKIIPDNVYVSMEDVHIHGFGSNCIVSDGNTVISGRNIRLGNSCRNHLWYSIKGEFTNLTCYGFAWGVYGKTEHVTFYGLRFENLTDFPFTQDPAQFGGVWTVSPYLMMYEGLRWNSGGTPESLGGSAHRYQRIGFNVIGGHWDLDGSNTALDKCVFAVGRHLTVQDVVILGPKTGTVDIGFLTESVAGSETVHENWVVRNITYLRRGGRPLAPIGNIQAQITIQDFSISEMVGYEGLNPTVRADAWANIRADAKRSGQNANFPRRITFERFRSVLEAERLFDINVSDANATPIAISIRDSMLELMSAKVLRGGAGTGVVASLTIQDLNKIRIYMENTQFRFQAGGEAWSQAELFFALTRFRNCATLDGLVSEQSGLMTMSAVGGETSVDLPTILFWAPEVVHVGARSATAAARFAHVEVLASDGATAIAAVTDKRSPVLRLHFDQPLGAGDDVRLAWDVAVRPF